MRLHANPSDWIEKRPFENGLFSWLPLLGSNHATLFRYAQRRVCFANIAQRNKLRNHDVLSVQAKQKKEKQVKAIVGLSIEDINKIKETFKNPKQGDAERYKYVQEIKEKRKNYLDKMMKLRKEKAPQEKIVPKTQKVNKGGKKH